MCYNWTTVGFIGDEDYSSAIPDRPAIYCYVCGKEVKTVSFYLSWGDDAYRVEGTCCGRGFTALIKWDDIKAGKVPTFVVNMV